MIFADLGPLAVEVDGLQSPVSGRRLASVLALLLARVGEVVTPAALVDAVWGPAAPARASQSLESLVWRLRKLLEPERTARQTPSVLRTEERGYRLAVPPDSVESHLFVAAMESLPALFARRDFEQALEVASSALERWRGEPYEGVPDADWIGPVRERLIALHTDLNEYRVQALLDTGQPERAVSELVPLLASHPFRERFWAQRMLGLYRSGRQAAALEAFTHVRRLLADELGVEPGPELRALQRQLLDQEPSLDPAQPPAATTAAARVRLPGRRGAIIGREDDLAAVVPLLGGAGLVTLTGPGGTGKTRLAVEAAFHARGGFADGVWFVDLTQTVDPDGVATLTANTLGLGPQPHTSTEQQLLDHLAPRRMLLVLDNCEHVLTGVRALADQILDHCPDVTLLATSREPLEIAGESLWPVAPLPITDSDTPIAGTRSATTKGAAVALFVERLGNQRPDLDLAGPDGLYIRQICAAVGGLPLGIELAAARARVFELDEIAATLATAPAQLTRSGAGPQRQASLLDAVDWSYRLARPDERILHRRLACIGGPVTLEGAAALCGVPPLRPEQAMELLGGLVHRSLLTSTRSTRSTRSTQQGRPTTFTQLVPIRAHAAAGLAETPEREAVERARDDWVIGHVAAAPNDGRPGLADFYDWLDDNEAAVRETLRSTLLTDPRPAGLTLLAALGSYWFERSRQIEGGQWALVAKDLPDRVQLDEFDASIAGLMHGCMLALNHEAASAEPYLMAAFTALREPPESRLAEAAETAGADRRVGLGGGHVVAGRG